MPSFHVPHSLRCQAFSRIPAIKRAKPRNPGIFGRRGRILQTFTSSITVSTTPRPRTALRRRRITGRARRDNKLSSNLPLRTVFTRLARLCNKASIARSKRVPMERNKPVARNLGASRRCNKPAKFTAFLFHGNERPPSRELKKIQTGEVEEIKSRR